MTCRPATSGARRSTTPNSRCLTIHGTHSLRVSSTIGYETRGHCFFLEDGVETDNQLRGNLGLVTRRPAPGKALLESDDQPATYWISNPTNTLVGNVAAGSEGNGFWYDLPERTSGMFADLELNPRTMPMGVFSGNTAHSNNNASGKFRSGSGLLVEDYEPPTPAVFNGLLAYKNRGFGAWAEGVTVAGARFVGNDVGFLGRFATLRDSLAVGHSPNNGEIPWSMIGTGFYVDESTVSNVTYARFRNHEWRHGAAIGSIVEHQTTIPRVSRARFINSRRVRVPAAWMDEGHEPGVAFRDVDGSVLGTGKPSTIVANNPLLLTAGCQRVDWIDGSSCPANLSLTSLRMVDMTGGTETLIPTQVTRDDGASDPAWRGHDWRPVAQATVLMGNHYTLRPQRETPTITELTFANDQRGAITVAVPWSHGQPYVYDGWGVWAEPVEPAASAAEFEAGGKYLLAGGMLKVKFRNDGYFRWQRQMLCAQRGCGEGLGSKRGG